MPHALIIAAAVSAGVGAAIAFEVNVFKPWRDEHWIEGWAEGIKQDWDEFAESVRDNFNEMSGDNRRHHRGGESSRYPPQNETRRRRRNSTQQDEMELRREMDEFSQHTAQVSGIKARYMNEFDQGQSSARLRKGNTLLEDNAMEDRLLDAPTSNYHNPSFQSQYYSDNSNSAKHLSPPSIAPLIVDNSLEQYPTSSKDNPSARHNTDIRSEILTNADNAGSLSAGWHDHFPPRHAPSQHADADGNESDSWTQLNDSRSASPLSASWSETELSQTDR